MAVVNPGLQVSSPASVGSAHASCNLTTPGTATSLHAYTELQQQQQGDTDRAELQAHSCSSSSAASNCGSVLPASSADRGRVVSSNSPEVTSRARQAADMQDSCCANNSCSSQSAAASGGRGRRGSSASSDSRPRWR